MWAPLPSWGVLAPPGGAWGLPVAWWGRHGGANPRHQITPDIRQRITGRDQLAHINWHRSVICRSGSSGPKPCGGAGSET
jgi:hypothetical protein